MKKKYPILYKIGLSEYEDIPIEDVPKHWKDWYITLGKFWKRWVYFKSNPTYKDNQWAKHYLNINKK